MCGIVGYVGEKKCTPILLSGLKNLEYRGYDSAGIATIENNYIEILKEKGKVKNLENLINDTYLSGTIGIAHTRWATHGVPSKKNSHPHHDISNNFSVVHNGIIENYKELKNFLEENDYTFYSETDSEVIPNLIHYYYSKGTNTQNDFLQAVSLACKNLKGSFAILVLCKDFPSMQIAAKKDSPLIIGKGENEYYIASDIPAILEYTKDFYFLEDNEICKIEKNSINFFTFDLECIKKDLNYIDLDVDSNQKNGYEDFMIKEIHEQPQTIFNTIKDKIKLGNLTDFSELHFSKKDLHDISQIYIIGCGSAMHAGLVGKNIFEKLCNIPTFVEIASEFRYRNPIIDKHTLCIFISQSGETADTIAALKLAKQKNAKTIAISNVLNSSITRETENYIYTKAGCEISVASTKAYSAQVCLICSFAIYLAEILKSYKTEDLENLKRELLDLPEKIELILQNKEKIKDFAKQVYLEKDIFFLGRGIDYCACLEASLKLKEISYIHSEAYAAGELKHGPIALIEDGITVVGILTDDNLIDKTISNIQEVITRGAKTLIITNQEFIKKDFEFIFTIPKTNSLFSPMLSIIPLQLFAYYISKEKGLDVDKPRNLAKSVTVE